MNYTLHQLEIFLKITEYKSITKASEALFLTQPAVSIQLKNFQEQFPIPLTEVVGRKLYVTEFGQEIAVAAEKILEEVAAINYKTLAYQGELSGKLKLSIVSTAKYVIPYFLAPFMKENTGVELVMDVTNRASVVNSLEKNEVDFAMVSLVPTQLKLNSIELMKNELYLIGGRQFSMNTKAITKKHFETFPLIYREKGSATRIAMENFVASKNLPSYKKIELTSNEALKQAVIAGLGLSVMPLIGIKNELSNGDLQIIPITGLPLVSHWNLVWLSSKKLSPIASAFLEVIEEKKQEIMQNSFKWIEKFGAEL